MPRVQRRTVDLSAYPDLVVIYLGMQAYTPRGLLALARLGPQIRKAHRSNPDGLLRHEDFVFLQWPPHIAFRQYWRDFDTMEAWTRQLPHQQWWREFLKNSRGTGFWHETHTAAGIEAVYDDMHHPPGLATFAEVVPATGRRFGSRGRLRGEAAAVAPVYDEDALPG
jgi:hypothetical protein